jgi:hypothetical protein
MTQGAARTCLQRDLTPVFTALKALLLLALDCGFAPCRPIITGLRISEEGGTAQTLERYVQRLQWHPII